jgi:hypothetical protein
MATKKPDPRKYETTKKAKKQVDAMTADIANKFGFNAPKTKVSPTPKPTPKKTLGPLPKNPTLNDYLARGLKVPKAPGQKKLPSDADVILKGYNDKKTINKYKKK